MNVEETTEMVIPTPELNITEACDKCGLTVRATHIASKDGMELYFCSHHTRRYVDKLVMDGFKIIPEEIGF